MAGKVQKFSKSLAYTATYANGVLSVTTAATHYLATGDKVSLTDGQGRTEAGFPITVTGAATFTIQARLESFLSGIVVADVFRTGSLGRQILSNSRSSANGAAAVIQSFVTGTGAASYTIDASLDGVHWTNIATITHAAITNDTQAGSVAPAWAFISINITAIGAATSLEVFGAV